MLSATGIGVMADNGGIGSTVGGYDTLLSIEVALSAYPCHDEHGGRG